jgi:hypothetical protein
MTKLNTLPMLLKQITNSNIFKEPNKYEFDILLKQMRILKTKNIVVENENDDIDHTNEQKYYLYLKKK